MTARNIPRRALLPGLLAAMCLLSSVSWGKEVALEVTPGQRVLLAGTKQPVYLRVAMTGFEVDDEAARPAVNVAFVLDKSGSMQGARISEARRAVRMAMDMLRDDDIVSVVTYDSTVQVLTPATRLRDRAAVYAAIEGITADGTTALFAGVSKGAEELRKFAQENQVNRLVLLSDGLANVGPSSPGELAELGKSLGRDGITVSTIGLGLGYNEDLMTRLALASDGNHMFAEQASDLELAFAREFGGVLSVAAQQIEVSIQCAEGVRPVRMLGREADIVGQDVTYRLNQLYGGQTRYAILEVEAPAGAAGAELPLAAVSVSYLNLATNKAASIARRAVVSFTDEPSLVETGTDPVVMADAAYQIGVEQNQLAVRLRDEGKVEEARQVLRANVTWLVDNAVQFGDERLREYSWSNDAAIDNLDSSSWTRQRKVMRSEQHEIVTQQKK